MDYSNTQQYGTLLKQIQSAISESVSTSKIGVAFSGGVDSSLISKICHDLGYEVTLLTVGFPNSPDILFAKDVNQKLNLPHHIMEIESTSFQQIASEIHNKIQTNNLSWNENCIAFYYVSKLSHSLDIDTVVTANGIDELFCGYNAYREVFAYGENKINELMNTKLENEIKMMKTVNKITSQFNVKIVQPLLSKDFIDFAKTIPIAEKIHDSDDLLRKHAIRKLAKIVGIPEISYTKRKKALQYGTKIHKELLKSR